MITVDLNGGLDYYKNRYKVVYACDTDGLLYQVRMNADSPEDAANKWEELETVNSTRLAFRLIEVITEKDWSEDEA